MREQREGKGQKRGKDSERESGRVKGGEEERARKRELTLLISLFIPLPLFSFSSSLSSSPSRSRTISIFFPRPYLDPLFLQLPFTPSFVHPSQSHHHPSPFYNTLRINI